MAAQLIPSLEADPKLEDGVAATGCLVPGMCLQRLVNGGATFEKS